MWASFLISQKLRFLICKMTTLNCCRDEMGQVLQSTMYITPVLASILVPRSVCGFGQYCRTERETDVHAPSPSPLPQMLTLWCHLLQANITHKDDSRSRPQAWLSSPTHHRASHGGSVCSAAEMRGSGSVVSEVSPCVATSEPVLSQDTVSGGGQ